MKLLGYSLHIDCSAADHTAKGCKVAKIWVLHWANYSDLRYLNKSTMPTSQLKCHAPCLKNMTALSDTCWVWDHAKITKNWKKSLVTTKESSVLTFMSSWERLLQRVETAGDSLVLIFLLLSAYFTINGCSLPSIIFFPFKSYNVNFQGKCVVQWCSLSSWACVPPNGLT